MVRISFAQCLANFRQSDSSLDALGLATRARACNLLRSMHNTDND